MEKQNELRNNVSIEEIRPFVKILEDLNDKEKYTNYQTLCKDLLVNFGIRVKIEQIRKIYEN